MAIINEILGEYGRRVADLGWGRISEVSVKEMIKLSLEDEISEIKCNEKHGNVNERHKRYLRMGRDDII